MAYSEIELDGLKEIVNVGGGNAATSISQMINSRVDMDVPEVEVMAYDELYQKIIADDVEMHAVLSKIVGDIDGALLFVIADESGQKIAKMMLGSDDNPSNEIIASAVTELTNILFNSFLRAIGDMLQIQLIASLPISRYDFFGAIISSAYMAFDHYDEQILVIHNEFTYNNESLDASLFLIPGEGVLDKIFKALGI
ncbi:chemotaxis protein CheC [Ligilactobacillus agilis]|uniref:Chemotaxis protein CheC n=1 Tax=Ligilactobacillus agilis TaxID=1601 RepID=A0A222W304_9LACO|nr:chemotaxis protein CheC [Ligilactobacillus agilis]ASR40558.1 chemotaxis protein CheC [Ligilactobacillus agilis]MBL1055351.1 chemotaxis protein CheC [Ligilactobacillus agilis]MBM6763065.1 chemotaxis protein CheC [Ligilactobacillus agilis]MBM6772141.1 chemotaxis protein CheC [Ligilactobacillus agilis]MDO4598280.1 chemotaxis protein CheC [Ligilactobacillus agilis]